MLGADGEAKRAGGGGITEGEVGGAFLGVVELVRDRAAVWKRCDVWVLGMSGIDQFDGFGKVSTHIVWVELNCLESNGGVPKILCGEYNYIKKAWRTNIDPPYQQGGKA